MYYRSGTDDAEWAGSWRTLLHMQRADVKWRHGRHLDGKTSIDEYFLEKHSGWCHHVYLRT